MNIFSTLCVEFYFAILYIYFFLLSFLFINKALALARLGTFTMHFFISLCLLFVSVCRRVRRPEACKQVNRTAGQMMSSGGQANK